VEGGGAFRRDGPGAIAGGAASRRRRGERAERHSGGGSKARRNRQDISGGASGRVHGRAVYNGSAPMGGGPFRTAQLDGASAQRSGIVSAGRTSVVSCRRLF